jgi:hypothetical protein
MGRDVFHRVPAGRNTKVGDAVERVPTIAKKGAIMKPIIRYRSPLLFRKSYKPACVIRLRPSAKLNFVFRPVNRFGAKPQLVTVP